MLFFKPLSLLLASSALVAGHGYVSSIEVDGTTYCGYLVDTYYYESDPPELIAWSTNVTDDGYVAPTAYSDSSIICHRGSSPGALSAPVPAGGSVKLTWNTWPDDHHGPVITYMANCNGACSDVDKTTLEFFKIDAGGLIDDSTVPGTWATDELIANSYSRTITVPSDIEAGYYVLRHEIIALHGAEDLDGAQNYPQCINLEVTGSGTATPSGTLGTALYKDTDAGIYVDIWNALSTYVIPGPALYTVTGSSSTTVSAISTTVSAISTTPAAIKTTSTTYPTTLITSTRPQTTTATSSSEQTAQAEPSDGKSTTSGSTLLSATPTALPQAVTSATVASSIPATTSGVLTGSCAQEDYWYCNDGAAFQRCVNGQWDESQDMANGTGCTPGISETITIFAT
jgi:hypothetical protein